jgi:hypothetical protein
MTHADSHQIEFAYTPHWAIALLRQQFLGRYLGYPLIGIGQLAGAVLIWRDPELRVLSGFLVGIGGLVVAGWLLLWWHSRRQLLQTPMMQIRVLLDAEGVHWRSERGNADIPWQQIARIERTRLGLLLWYRADQQFIPLPELTAEIESFVRRAVGSNQ